MALPIVACGQNPEIAKSFMGEIRPEYEMIHFIRSVEIGKTAIPLLLQGQVPDDPNNVGTKNYAKPPVAVTFGGAYTEENAEEVRAACKGLGNIKWLIKDPAKDSVAVGPGYGAHIAQRIKECLAQLREEGKLEGDGIVKY